MKNLCIIPILLFLIVKINASPLHTHYKHSIIIDTDCAIDDMRAISILLSLSNITIKAIMVSDGSLPPNEGALKVKSLLHEFHADTIPVMCGNQLEGINPVWRQFNQQLKWGSETQQSDNHATLQQITDIINNSPGKVTLICLGPLTNVAQLIKNNSETIKYIKNIIWYNESLNPLNGFNYECDTMAAKMLITSEIKINIISNLNNKAAVFDTSLYNTCKNSNTLLAKTLYNTHIQPLALKKIQQNHFKLWDELVAVFLTNPELFTIELSKDNNNIRYNTNYAHNAVKEVLKDVIKGKYKPGDYVALYGFPINRELYTYDVRLIMDSAITRYGLDEWKACVLTDEFHGHLGVFSIVGAKMGMRARDFFGIGTDLLNVVSFAGTKPPFSCMNDGIQVSTGATLGQGTIKVDSDTITKPSAIFTFSGISIKITLKPEYLAQVQADIHKGITQFGLADENYWSLIRQNALNYWKQWDRNKIFEVEILK
jgi:pyrimidine-specific ribonucleoside hydrolase